jgi:cell division protease FtsH
LSRKDWRHVIELSAGMTGADLEKLRRELAYDLLRLGRARATRDDIVEHINVIKYGIRDTRERTREELEHIAWHEAGHIVLSQLLNPDVAIRNASITSRGNAAGFVEFDGEAHRNRRMTRKEVKEDLIILMGGRAAQVIKFGEDGIDAGVADDLAKARELAWRAIAEWGMEMVGAAETERHVGQWLASAEIEARRLLESHSEALETTCSRLISGTESVSTWGGKGR